jgi:uncharacterized MnhB-related membrane protein
MKVEITVRIKECDDFMRQKKIVSLLAIALLIFIGLFFLFENKYIGRAVYVSGTLSVILCMLIPVLRGRIK